MCNASLSLTSLAHVVASHLDVKPGEVRLEPCATGKHNQTYFVDVDEQSLVLRVAPPDDPARMLFYTFVPERHDATRLGKREHWGVIPLDLEWPSSPKASQR